MNLEGLFEGYIILAVFYLAGVIAAAIWAPWWAFAILASPLELVALAFTMLWLEEWKLRKKSKRSRQDAP